MAAFCKPANCKTAFISGHIDVSEEEFLYFYAKPIDQAIAEGNHFVVGDAPGVDLLSQKYVVEHVGPKRITVFCRGTTPRCLHCKELTVIYGFESHEAKDAAMTKNSDYDIAFVRSVEEQKALYGNRFRPRISGTEKNLLRRNLFVAVPAPSFDFFVVLDFEAVFDKPQPTVMDIIEFPSVLVDAHSNKIVSEFQKYVKPLVIPTLNPICTQITGITQSTVDMAEAFPIVHQQWKKWLQASVISSLPLSPQYRSFCFVTCGDWDIKTMLPAQFINSSLVMDEEDLASCSRWINIKDCFNTFYKGKHRQCFGMAQMLQALNLPLQGRHHSGIDDCRNIASILLRMRSEGAHIDVTSHRLQIPGQNSTLPAPISSFFGDMSIAVSLPLLEKQSSAVEGSPPSQMSLPSKKKRKTRLQ